MPCITSATDIRIRKSRWYSLANQEEYYVPESQGAGVALPIMDLVCGD